MASRAKRLMLMVGMMALVAVIAGAVMLPDTGAASKGSKAGLFVITTAEQYVCCGTAGSFEATGAITGTGQAYESWCDDGDYVYLRGALGDMDIEIITKNPNKQTFEVVSADGDYAQLLGATGSYTGPGERTPKAGIGRIFEGAVPK
jgi:hypothetical protein